MQKRTEYMGEDYPQCSNCSKAFVKVNAQGRSIPAPAACDRCGSPMEFKQAQRFGDEQAKRSHDPALAAAGARMRGEAPVDKMVRAGFDK